LLIILCVCGAFFPHKNKFHREGRLTKLSRWGLVGGPPPPPPTHTHTALPKAGSNLQQVAITTTIHSSTIHTRLCMCDGHTAAMCDDHTAAVCDGHTAAICDGHTAAMCDGHTAATHSCHV